MPDLIVKDAPKDKQIMVYPDELATGDYPHIEFSYVLPDAMQAGRTTIHLAMPVGLRFSDGGEYSSVALNELAPLGNAAKNAMSSIKSFSDAEGAVKAIIGAGKEVGAQITSLTKAEATQYAATKLGAAADIISIGTKSIVNPNTRTNFTGNNLRSFSFEFRMMAKSAAETAAIRNIIFAFRKAVYASSGANELVLRYPPIWWIKFYSGATAENPYLPKILSGEDEGCYLESVSTTFNGSTNLWHTDGSPVEVNVTLNFKETRMLKLTDIEKLMPDLPAKGQSGEKRTKRSFVGDLKKIFSKNK